MRILIGSDFHGYDKAFIDFSVLLHKHYDVGILAGDLATYTDDLNQQENFLKQLMITETDKPIYFIMGNDDGLLYDSPWTSYKNILNIHNQNVMIDDYNLIGYQYTPVFMGGKFEKPESEIKEDLDKIKIKKPEKTIFVSHTPPYGILDLSYDNQHFGSKALNSFMEANHIKYHVFGHIHNDFGYKGGSINAAFPTSRKYMSLNLDDGAIETVEGIR